MTDSELRPDDFCSKCDGKGIYTIKDNPCYYCEGTGLSVNYRLLSKSIANLLSIIIKNSTCRWKAKTNENGQIIDLSQQEYSYKGEWLSFDALYSKIRNELGQQSMPGTGG